PGQWAALLSVARAEALLGTLAHRLGFDPAVDGADGDPAPPANMPPAIAALLRAAAHSAAHAQRQALWEGAMCARALEPAGVPFVLLKGTAYAAAGSAAAPGRQIGDLDIMVDHAHLAQAEAALIEAGWEWVKADDYDQAYYRDHMHELPPLIHRDRDRMIDVHHTILPLTARIRPNAAWMMRDAVVVPGGWRILCPADALCHAAAHMVADGDLAGGLRNLWDIDRMLRQFSAADAGFWHGLTLRAQGHGLWGAVHLAARLAHGVYGTPLPPAWAIQGNADALFVARLFARDDWGRETRRALRLAFYIRSHWMRMPPAMLARHLWTKWRKG
ncbi:MAG: nucleotidyltransferase family protein, partial [Sphingopyxis sp.]